MHHAPHVFRRLTYMQYATDFYQAITNITSGLMLPLTTADLLTHAIVGSVLENLDMERLVREVGQAVSQRILGNNESVDDVARELHERLLLRNESTKKVVIESIYRDSEEAKHNVNIYTQAPTLAEARPHLKRVWMTRRSKVWQRVDLSLLFRCLGPGSPTSTSTRGWLPHEAPTTARLISPLGLLRRRHPQRRLRQRRHHGRSSPTSKRSVHRPLLVCSALLSSQRRSR